MILFSRSFIRKRVILLQPRRRSLRHRLPLQRIREDRSRRNGRPDPACGGPTRSFGGAAVLSENGAAMKQDDGGHVDQADR